jgi:hypothetical protein
MCDIYDVIESSYNSADVIVTTIFKFGDNNLGNGVRRLATDMLNAGKQLGYEDCFNKAVPVAYNLGKKNGIFIGSFVTFGIGTLLVFTSWGISKLVQQKKESREDDNALKPGEETLYENK